MSDYDWAVVIYLVGALTFAGFSLFVVLRELPPRKH